MKNNDAPAFGDDVMPGSRLAVRGRVRTGELPAPRRGSRKRPPTEEYGTKGPLGSPVDRSGPRTSPWVQMPQLESDNADRKHRLRQRWGRGRGDPRNKPGNRHFGELAKSAQLAGLLAKRAELVLIMDVLKHQQRVQCARSIGLSEEYAAYLHMPLIKALREQDESKRAETARMALSKSQQSFWDTWLAKVEAMKVPTMKALR
jgi:hypothetical protein